MDTSRVYCVWDRTVSHAVGLMALLNGLLLLSA